MNPIVRGIPVLTFAGGLVGGIYWNILPDVTNFAFGTPFAKNKLLFFDTDKDLDEHNLKLSNEVKAKLLEKGANEAYVKNIDFFWSKTPDVVCLGSTGNLRTSFIGLPVHFLYQHVDQVHVKSDTKDGKLRQSLVLSDSAKQFAMASAFYRLNSFEFMGKLALLVTSIGPLATYDFLKLFIGTKSTLRQLSLVFAIIAAWAFVFYQLSKELKSHMVYSSDQKAAELGSEFLDGGIKYFTKIVDRNKTIHEVGAEKDSKIVDADGNQVCGLFEIPEPQFTSRYNRLKQMLEDKQEK